MTDHLRTRLIGAIVALLAVAVGAGSAGPVGAQDAVSIDRNSSGYTFAERMSFTLEAESDVPIEDAVLRYTVGVVDTVNRRIPVFTPGRIVSAHHEEDLVRGEIPPAAEITWWWTLSDADGNQLDTERRSFRYLDERFDWQTLDGDEVRVWWYGDDDDRAVAEQVAADARAVLVRLGGLVGTLPEDRVEIVVYQRQDDMRPALAARGDTYESRLATLGARVAADTLLLDAGTSDEDLSEVLAHELSHIVVNLHIGREYIDLPLWLDEGLAMYVEGPLDADERATLADAIADDALMSVRSLTSFPGDAALVPLAYAESRDIMAFLIESRGPASFRQFLDLLATGQETPADALAKVYGYDPLTLYQAYREARGLPPATTPEPGDSAAARRRPEREGGNRGAALPCAGLVLLVPALALTWIFRRA